MIATIAIAAAVCVLVAVVVVAYGAFGDMSDEDRSWNQTW